MIYSCKTPDYESCTRHGTESVMANEKKPGKYCLQEMSTLCDKNTHSQMKGNISNSSLQISRRDYPRRVWRSPCSGRLSAVASVVRHLSSSDSPRSAAVGVSERRRVRWQPVCCLPRLVCCCCCLEQLGRTGRTLNRPSVRLSVCRSPRLLDLRTSPPPPSPFSLTSFRS